MKKNSKWGPFLAGMLAGAMLLGCGTAALAANAGGVSFGKMELKVMGKTAVAAGETATNAAGCQIPSTLLYTDETGGGTTYVPLRTFSELLEIPLDWENDTIYLGGKPGKVEVNFDAQGPDPVSANRPKTQVGAKAGPYTEVEPYWPEKEEILGTFEENTHVIASSGAGGSATTDPYKGGDISISITNNTQWSLRFTVRSPHIFSTQDDVLPSITISLVGTLGSQPGVSSVSRQSYNKGSNWLTTPFLGCEVRMVDCQPSSCCGIRFKQVEP